MAKERSKYCVFYLNQEGELLIRENIGVNDLAEIYSETSRQDLDILVFNMGGIAQFTDIMAHPENTYTLISINQGQLQAYEEVGPEIEAVIQEAELYYIVDDVFFITEAALEELIK